MILRSMVWRMRNRRVNIYSSGWVEFLAEKGDATVLDLAVDGATMNNSVVKGIPYDVVSQVEKFEQHWSPAPSAVPWKAANTLFTVWVGINDVGVATGKPEPWSFYEDDLLASYDTLLGRLYKRGARKFLIMSIPPTNRAPFLKDRANVKTIKSVIESYNVGLSAMARHIPEKYQGASITFFNTQPLFRTLLDKPRMYGFRSTSYCQHYTKETIWRNPSATDDRCKYPMALYTWSVHAFMTGNTSYVLPLNELPYEYPSWEWSALPALIILGVVGGLAWKHRARKQAKPGARYVPLAQLDGSGEA
ncbi:hypothetical protein MNV49_004652 [Pseudohyphozyma bogoriensis]|nr:hypothetical protein MNV49_004652 [Pseudohyphozyma bogoriensis]